MKKCVLGVIAAILATGSMRVVYADTLIGLDGGVDQWWYDAEQTLHSNPSPPILASASTTSYFLALEHPLPILPNIRLQGIRLQAVGGAQVPLLTSDGQTTTSSDVHYLASDFRSTSYILYYDILDNGVIALDLGILANHLQSTHFLSTTNRNSSRHTDTWLPAAYLDTRIHFPGSDISMFSTVSVANYQDDRWFDAQLGVVYQFMSNPLLNANLRLGYRKLNVTVTHDYATRLDTNFKGYFSGLSFHF